VNHKAALKKLNFWSQIKSSAIFMNWVKMITIQSTDRERNSSMPMRIAKRVKKKSNQRKKRVIHWMT